MPTIRVRRAAPADAGTVAGLICLLHEEAPAGSLDREKVAAEVRRCLATGWVYVSEQAGVIGATMGLHCQQWWWSQDWFIGDQWLFVHPHHRRAPHARLLLRAAKQLAAENAVPLVVGLFSQKRLPGKIGLLQRELGPPSGGTFLVRPPSNGKENAHG